ncbi:MAG: hypothetical protein P1V20_02785 [Verrucomicrobiales bacterium]|nr:hypothetical protein [Verrucomicrobiales bacterium]
MKLPLLLTTLIGALTVNGAIGGTYCPPVSPKCPVECCPDSNGEISIGYHSDYILHGVRFMRDNITADVNYTFHSLPVPITLGARQITGLSSSNQNGANFDESDIYATVQLPGVFGFETSVGYIHRFFPNLRPPTGANQANNVGDSRGELWLLIERELFCGVSAYYRRGYDNHMPSAMAPLNGNTDDAGAWIHELGLEKSLCLTDCVGLDLSAGVLYTDNYWPSPITAARDGALDRVNSSGWNSYYLKASLPIVINCNATLVPYLGYNGTPDSWMADGVDLIGGGNANDIFHGGVSLKVSF